MVRCSVLGCKSDSGRKLPDLTFHTFPINPHIRIHWIEATGRKNWTPNKSSRICSTHFEKNFLVKKNKLTILFPNAIPLLTPTNNMPSHKCSYFRCQNTSDIKSMFRFPWNNTKRLEEWLNNCGNMTIAHLPADRLRSRYLCIDHFNVKYISKDTGHRKRLLNTAIPEHYRASETIVPSEGDSPLPDFSNTLTAARSQIRRCYHKLAKVHSVDTSNATTSKLTELNKQALKVTVARIEANPQLYIGIPKNCYHLLELIRKKTKISTVHILLCLKKVKLDTHFEELADQFGIPSKEAEQVFVAYIPLIASALQCFITNLDNSTEAEQCNLPIPFRAKHQNAACILDLLELKIQPSQKHIVKSEAVKYVICNSPDGFINCVSPGYGGWNSDEMVLENTKYLDILNPGSCVIVKKGFRNIEPILRKRELKLFRPGLTQGPIPGLILLNEARNNTNKAKPDFDLEDHVKRVMHRVREFTMINGHSVISADLVRVVDDAVVISCALINIQTLLIN